MVDDAVRLLPGNKFAITFDDKLVGRPVEAVECSVEIVDDVTEPLSPLTVRTVEVVVPHIHVHCPDCLLPVVVQERIVAGEGAGEFGGIAGFVEAHLQNLHIGRDDVHQDLSVHPREVLIFLDALSGDIFTADAFLAGDDVVVGDHRDDSAGRALDLQARRELAVVREAAVEGVSGLACGNIFPVAEILPLRNRPADKLSERRHAVLHSDFDCRTEAGLGIGPVPVFREDVGIEAYVVLAETVICDTAMSGAVASVDFASPALVGENLHSFTAGIEYHCRDTAAHVAEAGTAEVPQKDADPVSAALEIRSDLDLVIIAVARGRTSLQATLEDNQLVIDPEPVLAVGRNAGHQGLRNFVQCNILSEGKPGVCLTQTLLLGDPLCFPRILLSCRTDTCQQGQDGQRRNCEESFHYL